MSPLVSSKSLIYSSHLLRRNQRYLHLWRKGSGAETPGNSGLFRSFLANVFVKWGSSPRHTSQTLITLNHALFREASFLWLEVERTFQDRVWTRAGTANKSHSRAHSACNLRMNRVSGNFTSLPQRRGYFMINRQLALSAEGVMYARAHV